MTHSLRAALLTPALALLLAPALRAYSVDPGVSEDDGAYATGTKAMNEHRWSDAVTSFDRVVEAKGKKADAALYWKAYSLNKLGSGSLALATCYQLRSRYTGSPWNRDCTALTMDLRAETKTGVSPVSRVGPVAPIGPMGPTSPMGPISPVAPLSFEMRQEDEGRSGRGSDADLKLLALNSLLNRDPAQAIPLLRGILSGDQPEGVKRHAIFVLAQSKSPEAQSILHDVVQGKMGTDLQRQAIQMSGVFQGKRANDSLAEVYRTTHDAQVKRSVISAFFISQDAPRMVELARSEKDLELKRSIVSQLALMPDKAATDYMLELLK